MNNDFFLLSLNFLVFRACSKFRGRKVISPNITAHSTQYNNVYISDTHMTSLSQLVNSPAAFGWHIRAASSKLYARDTPRHTFYGINLTQIRADSVRHHQTTHPRNVKPIPENKGAHILYSICIYIRIKWEKNNIYKRRENRK